MKGKIASLFLIGFMVCFAAFASWVNESKPPEPIPEQWKVVIIDSAMRVNKAVAYGLAALGLNKQFSPFERQLSVVSILTQVTGNPTWTYQQADLKITDEQMAGVRVKMYEPVSTLADPRRPVVIYLHGGAWCYLSVDAYEPLTSKVALEAGVVVISVDYRLSPQTPFPGPRSDCLAVVKHILANGQAMGLDTKRIALAGDSAGGSLSASLALELKGQIALQMLLVPTLQSIDTLTPSAIENRPYMSASVNDRIMWSAYFFHGGLPLTYFRDLLNNTHVPLKVRQQLGKHKLSVDKFLPPAFIRTPELRKKRGQNSYAAEVRNTGTVWKTLEKVFTDPYFAPLLAEDDALRQTAPCYVMTAGYDVIRDDGVMYFERLKHVGVKGTLKNYPEAFHHALMFHSGPLKLEVGERIVKDFIQFIKNDL